MRRNDRPASHKAKVEKQREAPATSVLLTHEGCERKSRCDTRGNDCNSEVNQYAQQLARLIYAAFSADQRRCGLTGNPVPLEKMIPTGLYSRTASATNSHILNASQRTLRTAKVA
jgi:hypothetical protein